MLRDAFIHTLVPATNQRRALLPRQLLRQGLVKKPSLRRKQDYRKAPIRRLGLQRADGLEEGLGFEDHPGPAAKRPVVHAPVAVVGEFPQVMQANAGLPAGKGALEHAILQHAPEELREDGDNVKSHALISSRSSGGSIKMVLACVSIFVQMACARGIRTSPCGVATWRTSTPPVGSMPVTVPTSTCRPPRS